MSQWEKLSHILWKIKNAWNHQPVHVAFPFNQPTNQPTYWTLIVGWTCWNPIWLVVYLPLWKIWKSVGIINIPNIWKNKKCSKPATSYSWWFSTILFPHTMLHHGGFDRTETLHRSAPPKVTRSRMENAALDCWSWIKSIWLNYNIGIYICFETITEYLQL